MKQLSDNDPLFAGFPGISTQEWEEKIKKDLKGADYERKLIWNTPEGFQVKPYYRQEDLEHLHYLQTLPGEFPFIRGFTQGNNDWILRQYIPREKPEVANRLALESITRGAQAIGFDVRDIVTQQHMHTLLAGIDPTKIGIHLHGSQSYTRTLELFLDEIDQQNRDKSLISGSLQCDPLGQSLLQGSFTPSWVDGKNELASILSLVQQTLPLFKVVHVSGNLFQNAGSTLVEELAFSLASGNEYLAALTNAGFEAGTIAAHMSFTFALGQSFFMEIAKLRAARLLWSTIVKAYEPTEIHACRMDIHCVTARWNMSVYDPHVNMLRSTTEGMSGALGNADSITILPFDLSYEKPGSFAERIARNQQLIFKEEAHLNKVADPAGGSYLVETLTDSIASHAWALFQTIEKEGGMNQAIQQNTIQDKILASRLKKEQAIAQRTRVMIGTNQYPNLSEKKQNEILVESLLEQETGKDFKQLTPYFSSSSFDRIRLATERYVSRGHKQPSVFLFTFGNLAMSRARAGFSTNFFGCAGFEIIDNPGFKELSIGVQTALASGAEIVVLCSADDEYSAFVPRVVAQLKSSNPTLLIAVAGYPKEVVEELKNEGVDGFIHVKSNLLEELQRFQARLGIQ